MARTLTHWLPVIRAGPSPCARCHWLSALCNGQSLAVALTDRRHYSVEPLRPRGPCRSRPALGTLLLLMPMDHLLDRHLFNDRDDVVSQAVRRGQLTKVVARIRHPQPITFTDQTDTRLIVFHDREAPTVPLSHDVGDNRTLRSRADREDRVLETTAD